MRVWERWAEELHFGLLTCVDDTFKVNREFQWEDVHVQVKHFAEGHLYFALSDFWAHTTPVPILNVDGTKRGLPDYGVGSNVDWHFLRESSHSLKHLKRQTGAIANLVQHTGNDHSTW